MAKEKQSKNRENEQVVVSLKAKALAFLKEVGIVLGAFLLLNNFVVASFLVPTGSMENEVLTGDLLFVNKFIYGGTSPRNIPFTNVRLPWFRVPAIRDVERGDVIVFEFPGYREEVNPEEFQFYLKRCVGLPGDTIQVIDRVLYVNGSPAPLPRNLKFSDLARVPDGVPDERVFPPGSEWNEDNYGPLVVPYRGMKILLQNTTYRKWETFIKREGHQIWRVADRVFVDGTPVNEYTVEHDYLFGMGDHRDNSLDSRYWGFIPKENLVGSPLLVYWSWDTNIPLYDIFGRVGSIRWNRVGTVIR
ncbi:MAG: signal peptidase I [Ignavibacteriales bacterium]|nr:signal peptidase I [Ignavibacteriales bacterium]